MCLFETFTNNADYVKLIFCPCLSG